jgi:Flp pilus assembly protein TadG
MFTKNRLEKDQYEVGFHERLATDEQILAADVEVEWAAFYSWRAVTDAVLGTVVSSDGKTVQFTLTNAATVLDQPQGRYRILAIVTTNKDRVLVGITDLMIRG